MTRNESIFDRPLDDVLDRAVETYGAVPVLFRAIVAGIRAKRPPPATAADELPAHLRRDVGLDPHLRRTPDRIFFL